MVHPNNTSPSSSNISTDISLDLLHEMAALGDKNTFYRVLYLHVVTFFLSKSKYTSKIVLYRVQRIHPVNAELGHFNVVP